MAIAGVMQQAAPRRKSWYEYGATTAPPRKPVTPAEPVKLSTPADRGTTTAPTATASPRKGIVGRASRRRAGGGSQAPNSFAEAQAQGMLGTEPGAQHATLGEAAEGLFGFVTSPVSTAVEVVTGDTPMGHLASVLGIDTGDFSISDTIGNLFGGGPSAPGGGGGGIPGTTTAGHSVPSAPSAPAPTAAPTSIGTPATGGTGPGPAGGVTSGSPGGAATAAANAASGVASIGAGVGSGAGAGASGTGGCFITTALVERRGEPDDGETMTLLREFRDGYMQQDDERRVLIDWYGKNAPKIVEAIPADDQDWEWIGNMVELAVHYLKSNSPAAALIVYGQMVLYLGNQYLRPADGGA